VAVNCGAFSENLVEAAAPVLRDCSAPQASTAREQLAEVFTQLYEEGGDELHARIERTLIESAYAFCQSNQVHTADLLGISRNVLRTQLKRFGLIAGAKALFNDEGDHHDTSDSPGFSARSIATV
jgi:transcriptional regulator with AAA-type ATPase domain